MAKATGRVRDAWARRCGLAGHLPAAIALTVILLVGGFAERQSRELALQTQRYAAAREVAALRAELQAAIGGHLTALSRLAGAITAQPNADIARFGELAAAFAHGKPAIRELAAAPAGGREMRHRVAGPPGTLDDVLDPRETEPTGTRVAAGQGAPALVVWMPVTTASGAAWGRVAIAVDAEALLAASGLRAAEADLNLALIGDEPSSGRVLGALFRDYHTVLSGGPVRVRMVMPGAVWQIAALPHGGWKVPPGTVWPIRLLTALVAGLIVVPMLRTRDAIEARQRSIADLRHREAELQRLSQRLGLALDASKLGVWELDIDRGQLVWNERMVELHGIPPSGRPRSVRDWHSRLHPDDLVRAKAEFDEAIRRTGRLDSEYRLALPGGAVRHIRAIGAVHRERDGSSKLVGVGWDVTADALRRAELDGKRLEAEAASSAKSQFLATMSHEIRTPMSGVIGMLDLLVGSRLACTERERALVARDSARQLLQILNDILDFSKLEADGVTLERADFSLRALARDVVTLMSAGAEARGIGLSANISSDVPEFVRGDPTRLRQVLMNLVGNAVKFTDAGRVVVNIDYEPRDGGLLHVAVRDTGVGIPFEARHRLFQRFAQVDATVGRERGGTGLGLAICKQLVELMGGEIAVDSVPGLGSTFRFAIPALPGTAPAPERAPNPARADHAAPPLRILVAEDNPTNQHILAAYLAKAGHAAQMVSNGIEAVAAVAMTAYDLVILDVQMPVMDGLTAARRIRALDGPTARIPIIALTANAMPGDRERHLAAGMTDYVSKPVSFDALRDAIARAAATAEVAARGDSLLRA